MRSGHRTTTGDAELLNIVAIVLALVVIAGLAVLFVARYSSLRRSVSIKDSGPLSEAERRELKIWARRTKTAFAGCMLFVVFNGVLLIALNPAPLWLGWLSLGMGLVIVGGGTSDPLFWAVPSLWLHHRFAESPLASMELREVQDTLPLMPPLIAHRVGDLRA